MFEGLFRPGHLLIILVIVLFFFGPSKLPQLGGALGKTIRDFKKAVTEGGDEPSTAAATPAKALEAKATEVKPAEAKAAEGIPPAGTGTAAS